MIKIFNYGEVSNEEVFARDNIAANVEPAVTAIIADVRARGDEALFEYTARFDKAQLTALEVSNQEIDEAFEAVEPEFLDILREAAANGVEVLAMDCHVTVDSMTIRKPVPVIL